jgi:menaquinol-cytochrome c reductase cytochrome b subunit
MKLPLPAGLRKPAKPGESVNGAGNGNAASPSAADRAKEGGADLVGWLDERTGGASFLTGMLYRKVPKGTNWYYTLGSATLFAFVVQAITGVFLAMYYTPSATQAYASITHLTNDVFLGEFVRGMHKWGATVMVILIFLHMARTFVFGAYKYPRELNWVIGVVLLILTLVMALTGYLLPFDQRSSRFYSIHMLLIPGLIIALIGAHLYLVVKLGTTAPPWLKAKTKPKSLRTQKV